MRGERGPRDTARPRHNKDLDNLKSSLKKSAKTKKHRVVFNESANEFFEADYIIVVRDECAYEEEPCAGCGACCEEPGALSPPEGYKDLGLFNRDGTLREQAWWDAGDVVLVGERSGTVFTPQHLALLRRLQRERMLRAAAAVCADCDAHAHPGAEYYDDEETSDVEKELRPVAKRTGKQIAAGEERPKTNSSQQTTPTEDCPQGLCLAAPLDPASIPGTSEESDTADNEGHNLDSSPRRHRKGGILKGGRLWKSSLSLEERETVDQVQAEDQRSATASDEDGSTTRSVRFEDRREAEEPEADPREVVRTRVESPLASQPGKNSAVQQLFTTKRPPPPLTETTPITAESLRAWDAGSKKSEELAIRRVGERNNLRCSLLRSEARKKQQPKPQETTSLAERIRILTCDVEDEPEERPEPSPDPTPPVPVKVPDRLDKPAEKFDRNEKAFGSGSSSSSSSTVSVPAPVRHQPDLGDHQEPVKAKPRESRRQFLPSLGPLTACVGGTGHNEGFYYMAADRASLEHHDPEPPAPDVLAGTPGAHDGDDGLAAFARANAPRTERLRQRYGQESQPVSSDDEHDDYGFHRRPAVRGIVARNLGASELMLQQMQSDLQPHTHCQRASSLGWYEGPARPGSRSSAASNWSKTSDYVSGRQCSTAASEGCYSHQGPPAYAYRQDPYRPNCSLYANIGCSDSSQDLYSSQTSSEQTSPVRGRARRAESPPPIRSQQQLLYVPYAAHQQHHAHWDPADYNRMQSYYQQQNCSGASTPQQIPQMPQQHPQMPQQIPQMPQQIPQIPQQLPQSSRAQYSHALHLQSMCAAPARYKPVPPPPPGGGKQMICYSEKVAAPLYQPAPGSPSRARGAGDPASTSPAGPAPNSVYYAMNV